MNATDYWPMAREYSVWNTAIEALQFWTADLEGHVLSNAIEEVYTSFLYAASAHTLHQLSDKILFSHFVTTLNTNFQSKLALQDEGYTNGSENFNIPTPLRRTSRIHHVSSIENASFDPTPVTPCSTHESHLRPEYQRLIYSPSEDDDSFTDEIPLPCSTPPAISSRHTFNIVIHLEKEGKEEDFQTISLDDDHWTSEEIPDRPLCIHKHLLSHGLCPYPCPYVDYQTHSYFENMDLSNISEFEDVMTTFSNKDIPVLKEITY